MQRVITFGTDGAIDKTLAISAGSGTMDSTGTLTAATGLTSVDSITANAKDSASPGLKISALTYGAADSSGNIKIYGWRPTDSANGTLVAVNDTTGHTINWTAIGKKL